MKNKIFLLLRVQILFSIETVFAQITFQRTFGGLDDDRGNSVQQTTDGGYIIAGNTWNFGAGGNDVYLIKTDAYGDSLWTRTFGGTSDDEGFSMQQTTDGGYIIAGQTNSFGAGDNDVYLIKTDVSGDLLWSKTFGGPDDERGKSVQQTADGGYIITGQIQSFGTGSSDVYLIKTDGNGDSLWTKTFGGAEGNSVQQTSDGGYIITGYTTNYNVCLIKIDTNGNPLWTKTFGGTGPARGHSVRQTTDGGYIIAGEALSIGSGNVDIFLIKTDANGDLLWSKTFGGANDDVGRSVQQTPDGGYIVSGFAYSFSPIGCLIRTDANGDSLWTKSFGGTGGDWGNSVQETTDGGYIITGRTNSFGSGYLDVYLIKADSLGYNGCFGGNPATIVIIPAIQVSNPATIVTSPPTIVTTPVTIVGSGGTVTNPCSTIGIQSANQQSEISLSPNPFSNEINITNTVNELSEIILYDITSRNLLQETFTSSTTINTSQLSKGIYIYEVRNINGVIKKGKVIKE